MNNTPATDMGINESGRALGGACASGPGVVHTFVDLAELRRIMGSLAAIELLRLVLDLGGAVEA